jgi:hypothetical protein
MFYSFRNSFKFKLFCLVAGRNHFVFPLGSSGCRLKHKPTPSGTKMGLSGMTLFPAKNPRPGPDPGGGGGGGGRNAGSSAAPGGGHMNPPLPVDVGYHHHHGQHHHQQVHHHPIGRSHAGTILIGCFDPFELPNFLPVTELTNLFFSLFSSFFPLTKKFFGEKCVNCIGFAAFG